MTLIKWSRPDAMGNRNDIYAWPYSIFDELLNSKTGGNAGFVPAVNVLEKAESFFIQVIAPGFEKEGFKLEFKDGSLVISGEHKREQNEEEKNYSRREYRFGPFSRNFSLPENVNVDGIRANYENGILNIELPKKNDEGKLTVKEIKVS